MSRAKSPQEILSKNPKVRDLATGKQNRPTSRITKEVQEKLPAEIIDMYCSRFTRMEIIENLFQRGLQRQAAEEFVDKVEKMIVSQLDKPDVARAQQLLRLQKLAEKVEKMGDFKLLLDIEKQISKILGIETYRLDMTSNGEQVQGIVINYTLPTVQEKPVDLEDLKKD